MATCLEIIQQIDGQWNDLLRVRSAFPTLSKDVIGAKHFPDTAPFYQRKGFHLPIFFPEPLTQETIDEINQIGAWINESYVIRLCALLEYNKVLPKKGKDRINKNLVGHDKIDILRRLRNALVHHSGTYNPTDAESRKLYNRMVAKFSLPSDSQTPANRFLVHIDKFLEPVTIECKRYTEGFFSTQ